MMKSSSRSGLVLSGIFLLLLFSNSVHAEEAGGSVHVSVVDRAGNSVTDARVTLVELGKSVYVDDRGNAAFAGVPPGEYHVEASSGQFGSAVEEFELVAGQDHTSRLTLGRSIHRERIVVTAMSGGRGSAEVVVPINVLDSEELNERMQPTLGETLAQEPGIHSTFFGAGASRPIIRGQSGGRVRILEDGIGVGDASTTSPDHAVGTDPVSADSIEVVRGPAALLYDTSAIGGLVNILDGRIPDHAPRKPFAGSFDLRLGSAADERTGAVDLGGGNEAFAWHLDASSRETHDYEIAGPAVVGDPDSPSDELPNSAVENTTLTAGVSALFDNGYLGVSARGFDSEYGIQEIELEPVVVPLLGEEEEEGGVRIDMQQRRFDLRGEFDFESTHVDRLKFSLGVTDYEHTEFEGGEAGTMFFADTVESRLELSHHQRSTSPGVVGVQYRNRDAEAEGQEAFVPENETDTLALFALQEFEAGPIGLELGGRLETNDLSTGSISQELLDRIAANPNCTTPADRDFNNLSASAGAVWLSDNGFAIGASLSHAVRAPGAEELYSCGPHLATQSFEVGNTELDEETGLELNVSLRKRTGRLTGEIVLFANRFDDYIFEEFTGRLLTEEGVLYDPVLTPDPEFVLPEYRFTQEDAEFYGAEFTLLFDLLSNERQHLDLELTGDVVRAELRDSGDYLPRIPASRVGIGLQYRADRWYGSASVRYTAEQDRLAPSETITSPLVEGLELLGGPTDDYTMVAATAGYRFVKSGMLHDFSLRGSNLTDEEARVHTSRLKNVAPLPGADISFAYRLVF
ncbi:MAG: TonB-dependent receptor [bacterium]|nr:TonB-dependent receptor [bacterium]